MRSTAVEMADQLDNGWPINVMASELCDHPDEVHALLDELSRRDRPDWAQSLVEELRRRHYDARAEERAVRNGHADPETMAALETLKRADELSNLSVGLDALLAAADEPYDWVVPGLLERGDRVIVTGAEGGGKSTLLRQWALRMASGLDPFTEDRHDPLRVLFVDAENSRAQTKRKMRDLRDAAGADYVEDLLRFEFRGAGLDLGSREDCDWLADRMAANLPDVLVIGPLYKLAGGDPSKEEVAKPVSAILDEVRTTYGAALLIEAHSPHGEGGKTARPIRPYGASLWLRWPEFGLHVDPNGALLHWRGARDERPWPTKLRRGSPWPWEIDTTVPAPVEQWDGPTHCMSDALDLLVEIAPTEQSTTEMFKALRDSGRGYRKDTISAALARLAINREIERRRGPRNADLYWYAGGPDAAP